MKKEYIVISSNRVEPIINEALEYTFGNLVILKNDNKEVDLFAFKKLENYKRIIIVGFTNSSIRIIARAKKENKLYFIYDRELSDTSMEEMRIIGNLLQNKRICGVAFLYESSYLMFKKNKKVSIINLNIGGNKSVTKRNSIGIISKTNDFSSSFYNSLSAASLLDFNIYVPCKREVNKKFVKNYGIKIKEDDNFLKNNLNIHINFYDDLGLAFMKSMNSDSLCLIGNNILLKNGILSEYLMVKSDDNVAEIYEKIQNALENKVEILKEYQKFKKNYDKLSKDSVDKFFK